MSRSQSRLELRPGSMPIPCTGRSVCPRPLPPCPPHPSGALGLSCMLRPRRSCQRTGSGLGGGVGPGLCSLRGSPWEPQRPGGWLSCQPRVHPLSPHSQTIVLLSIHSSGTVRAQPAVSKQPFCKESADDSFRRCGPERPWQLLSSAGCSLQAATLKSGRGRAPGHLFTKQAWG